MLILLSTFCQPLSCPALSLSSFPLLLCLLILQLLVMLALFSTIITVFLFLFLLLRCLCFPLSYSSFPPFLSALRDMFSLHIITVSLVLSCLILLISLLFRFLCISLSSNSLPLSFLIMMLPVFLFPLLLSLVSHFSASAQSPLPSQPMILPLSFSFFAYSLILIPFILLLHLLFHFTILMSENVNYSPLPI